jgi:hypothetical protein
MEYDDHRGEGDTEAACSVFGFRFTKWIECLLPVLGF